MPLVLHLFALHFEASRLDPCPIVYGKRTNESSINLTGAVSEGYLYPAVKQNFTIGELKATFLATGYRGLDGSGTSWGPNYGKPESAAGQKRYNR